MNRAALMMLMNQGGGPNIAELFATTLYTGNAANRSISLGFAPDRVWIKDRGATYSHGLFDRLRGPLNGLDSTVAIAQFAVADSLTSFDANGFSLGTNGFLNQSGQPRVAWSSKDAPRFTSTHLVSHTNGTPTNIDLSALGAVGMVVAKNVTGTGGWFVWHRSLTPGNIMQRHTTGAQITSDVVSVSGTTATLSAGNATGTYSIEAYAHDTASDGVIQCGTFTGSTTVELGWTPQFLEIKPSSNASGWIILDGKRGWGAGNDARLAPNTSAAEDLSDLGAPTSTGFTTSAAGIPFIYRAIRAP